MLCHLCETPLDEAVTVGTTARHGEPTHNVACSRCGLVQVTPLPSERELADYYATEYRRLYRPHPVGGHEPGTPEHDAALDASALQYAAMLVEELDLAHGAHVLEVGCGDGRLAAALMAAGMHVVACELDVDERLKALERGVDVRWDSLGDAVGSGYRFDAIVSSHVVEHLREPIEAFAAMASALTERGVIWAEVPNVEEPYGDLHSHYWQRAHLYSFSPHTAALAMLRAGCTGIQVSVEPAHRRVLFLSARAGDARRGYGEAVELLRSAPPDGRAVAARLEAYQAARASNPGLRLAEWMARDDEADRWLRDEMRRMTEALGATMQSLGKLAQDLDALGSTDAWRDDAWCHGYECGVRSMAQRANVVISHVANQLVTRAST
jgi:2-polyprenyl-3-methyl-5-hydroxy-6-metoxy-1,4-benzoquinol methylase